MDGCASVKVVMEVGAQLPGSYKEGNKERSRGRGSVGFL